MKLHMMMFPWVSYGHFIPFLHLSNKLAERGHKVSFLLPKSAQLKVEYLNQYPNLIYFFPLVIPQVEGIPQNAETASDVPYQSHNLLLTAFDQTQDQVESYISCLKPQFVFYDLAHWIPSLVRCQEYHCKSIRYAVLNAVMSSFFTVPSRTRMEPSLDELMKPPPGFPSSRIRINREEASEALLYFPVGGGVRFYDRIVRSIRESDALAFRTCREIEGSFCDYLSQQFAKSVLLTGPALPKKPTTQLVEKWANWLNKFEVASVVYCAFGSQVILQKEQFQEMVLGLELSGFPFLAAFSPPHGCATVEEALPEGFQERVEGRGWVFGGWVPQPLILNHPSIGCYVSHCGPGAMWESLFSDCQMVLIPHLMDQILSTKLMVEELKVAVEVERGENRWVARESLSHAIALVMDKDSVVAATLKSNHANLRNLLSSSTLQNDYMDSFTQNLHDLFKS